MDPGFFLVETMGIGEMWDPDVWFAFTFSLVTQHGDLEIKGTRNARAVLPE